MSNAKKTNAGYREIEHTADWALEVWAPDLTDLFVQSAIGMNALAEYQLASDPRVEREVAISEEDNESLMVSFLSELLFMTESENLAFDEISIDIENSKLTAVLQGAPLINRKKEIKAVTFHNLEIKFVDNCWRVQIVFDV